MKKRLALFLTVWLTTAFGSLFAQSEGHHLEQALNDTMITAKITAQFTKNRALNPLKIGVSTNDGIVTLKGAVPTRQALVTALRLCRQTKGVKAVETDNLTIQMVNTVFTDAYITAKVETAILKAKVFDDERIPLIGINASTQNGTVILTGAVPHRSSIPWIIKRVNAVNGVKKVVARIAVKAQG